MDFLLSLERLESRNVPSVTLNQGTLTITTDSDSTVIVSNPTPGVTEVNSSNFSNDFNIINGQLNNTQDFTGVTNIVYVAGPGNQYFANNTAIPSFQDGSNATNVVLVGGTNNDTLIGSSKSRSNTFEQDPSGSNVLIGGQGTNNLFGGRQADQIYAGPHFNAIYDILGINTVVGNGSGYLIVNAASSTTPGPHNQVITFFIPGVSQNGTSPVVYYMKDANGNGILYLNPLVTTGISFVVNNAPQNQISVTYNDFVNPAQTFFFDRKQISWIASFGTPGNDTLINNTNINNVFYGAAGNDTIIGGYGIDVLKGHSGNDYVQARGYYNDISAGPGSSTLVGNAFTIFRNNPTTTLDVNVTKSDIVIGAASSIIFDKLHKKAVDDYFALSDM